MEVYYILMILKFVIGVVIMVVFATGGYFAVREGGARKLAATVAKRMESGDYLAALAAAGELRESGNTTPELEEQVAGAARLLVAEDALLKAKQAVFEKRFADAGALLRGSDAITNPDFKYYEEAKKLYEESEAFAAGAAHKTSVTISTLETRAQEEKKRREETEAARKTLEGALSEKEKILQAIKADVTKTQRELAESQREAMAQQAAAISAEARAKALMEVVEKENRSKFFMELRIYRDMSQKGKEQLENAIAEINAKRDVTALIYASQGRILFEEAKTKSTDLRNSRTPVLYQGKVDDLVKSLEQFLEAVKQLRNTVVYIDDQNSTEFTLSLAKGKTALANAVSYLANISDLIASNP